MNADHGTSPLARALAPLTGTLWILSLVWSVLVSVVWTTGWSDAVLVERVPSAELRAALSWMLRALDAIWITLGAVNVYLALVRAEGLATARRWSAVALLAGLALPAASAVTGWPLGPVHYPMNLGMKLGPVPFALPMLWLLIAVGAREAAQTLLPRASHRAAALVAGGIALLTDLNLEPIAWKWRIWWLWYPTDLSARTIPPLQNFVTWLLGVAVLAFAMRSPQVAPRVALRPVELIGALAVLNAVCLLTNGVLFVRR